MAARMHSMIDHFPELDGFDMYAGDGHYIGASTHETLVQGKRRPVGHFYTLDLRSHGLTYLTGTDLEDGTKKGEHDMHALKRQSGRALKQGAKKGRKVLYLWDPAGIDFDQWGRWKQSYGVYFLSRAKKNMVFTELEKLEVDPTLAVNAGCALTRVAEAQASVGVADGLNDNLELLFAALPGAPIVDRLHGDRFDAHASEGRVAAKLFIVGACDRES